MHRLFVALVALVVWPSMAFAQNNAQPRDTTWDRQVSGFLDVQHRYPDFAPDASFQDWVEPLQRSRDRSIHQVRLEAGVTYRIAAACDADCTDVDMEAFDSSGTSVAVDVATNDRPFLDITPITTDTFTVNIWWYQCSTRPCFVGGRVLRHVEQGASLPVSHGLRSGTGFLVSADGLIVTNNHVVEGARSIFVVLGGERIPANIVARDPANDVAVVRAVVAGIPLHLRSATSTQRGEEVMTLGYPLVDIQGEQQKAAFGRVNALSGIGDDVRYLQIDVPIQPGNSGGPLLNQRGDVIGVVTATLDQIAVLRETGSLTQNVNYAVKADYVLPLIPPNERLAVPLTARPGTFPEVVAASERSVFQIIAE